MNITMTNHLLAELYNILVDTMYGQKEAFVGIVTYDRNSYIQFELKDG